MLKKQTKKQTVIPTFSVVIPTLNEERALSNLLRDLELQTFKDFELIIVDAKSTDKTKSVAEKFKTKFNEFKFIESEKKNVAYQRNLGAKEAKSNWIIFSDADNRLPSYFVQGIKFKIEMHNPDILSTWLLSDSNNRTDKTIALMLNVLVDMQKTSKNPYVQESLLVIKKSIFNKLHGFNDSLHWGEGNDLLRRGNRIRCKFVFSREPKYTFSFRRIRKFGTLKSIGRSTQMDLARLLHIKLSKDRASRIYPLEGGQYFEFDPIERVTIENLFLKLFQRENGNGNGKFHSKPFWQFIKERFFKKYFKLL